MNKDKLIELRCKAWGITENEYYCNQCSDFSLEDMARAYRRGKNKGARDKAIQIADLKAQIEKMTNTETMLKILKDRGVIRSWYYNGTYHVGNELPKE